VSKKRVPAEFVRSAATPGDFPRDGLPEVVLVGRSNVGKSSLINQLTGCRGLAAVSRTPGRTQSINFFRVEGRFYLVDLPGYGFARAPARVRQGWEAMVSGYLFDRPPLRLALLIVDARHEPQPNDLVARDLLVERGIRFLVVSTKSDKLSRADRARQRARLGEIYGTAGGPPPVIFSAVSGEGRKELWNAIESHVRGVK
jgi:GTP-binding protein